MKSLRHPPIERSRSRLDRLLAQPNSRSKVAVAAFCILFCVSSLVAFGQDVQPAAGKDKPKAAASNPAAPSDAGAQAKATPAAAPATDGAPGASTQDPSAKIAQDQGGSPDEIQLSLQGANIDMV